MNFNIFKNSNISRTSQNEEKENIIFNNRTSVNESDIFYNSPKNIQHLTYDNEVIMKLTNENEIQNNEISLLKSKIKNLCMNITLSKKKIKMK